jgi:hypothetical protein
MQDDQARQSWRRPDERGQGPAMQAKGDDAMNDAVELTDAEIERHWRAIEKKNKEIERG